MNNKKIKIMLVEDQKLMRMAIKSLFDGQHDMEIVKETASGKEAIESAKLLNPDVVLMDIGLPDINGIEVTKKLLEINKDIKVIMLTSHLTEQEVFDSLKAGVSAYIMKDFDTENFIVIVRTIHQGAMWLDSKVVPLIRDKNSNTIPSKQVTRAAFREKHANLTQREYEVLKLIVDGKSNNEIAKVLTISEHTAKAHVCNIIQKLVVDDRTQAAVKALKEGLV
ncbi:response regulator transcription factor [bacterium]|nr:response regulator transcription factor [bacterium]